MQFGMTALDKAIESNHKDVKNLLLLHLAIMFYLKAHQE